MPRIRRVTRQTRPAPAPKPRRTQRLTPLAFATPCTQIYCENADSHTSLLSNWHIVPRLPRKLPSLDWATSWLCFSSVSSLDYSTTWLSYLIAWLLYQNARLHHICTSITLRKAILPCFPQCNYGRQNFKEKLCHLCPELDVSRARPAPHPHPCRNHAAHSVSHH